MATREELDSLRRFADVIRPFARGENVTAHAAMLCWSACALLADVIETSVVAAEKRERAATRSELGATPPAPSSKPAPVDPFAGRDVVTTDEAAAYLNRAPQTLRKWASLENGPIRPARINGRLGWRVADLCSLVDANGAAALARGEQFLRLPEVVRVTGLNRTLVYQKSDAGTFPKRVHLGPRVVGWRVSDIEAWMQDPENYRQ